MYSGGTKIIKFLFVFLLLICPLLQGNLSQSQGNLRKVEGKLFHPLPQIELICVLTSSEMTGKNMRINS